MKGKGGSCPAQLCFSSEFTHFYIYSQNLKIKQCIIEKYLHKASTCNQIVYAGSQDDSLAKLKIMDKWNKNTLYITNALQNYIGQFFPYEMGKVYTTQQLKESTQQLTESHREAKKKH